MTTTSLAGAPSELVLACCVLGSSCLGFLVWNWPPAKSFLGDTGSEFLGYVLAVLAIALSHHDAALLAALLILGPAFATDATLTLIHRFLRGEKVYQAHPDHAYQHLSLRWGNHRRVTIAFAAVNVPCAWYAIRHPEQATWMVVVAALPLVPVALISGASREPERHA